VPTEPLATGVAVYFLMACWAAFAAIFLIRKKTQVASTELRRDRSASLPIAMQGVAFAIVWMFRLHPGTSLITRALTAYLDFFACALAVATLIWVLISVRTLGKQWTIAARLVEGTNWSPRARTAWCGIQSIPECSECCWPLGLF
jgi:hypothetical protein